MLLIPSRTCCNPRYAMASPIQYRVRAQVLSSTASEQQQTSSAVITLQDGQELDEAFTGLDNGTGLMTVAGFGSLLSERSARTTFPDLQNFRPGRLYGYRRVFAHTADIFFERGIANPATREIGSLSVEPVSSSSSHQQQQQPQPSGGSNGSSNSPGLDSNCIDSTSSSSSSTSSSDSLVVTFFEVPYTPQNVAAFIAREHEFRFLAVQPHDLSGKKVGGRLAVVCGASTDEHYRSTRCPAEEWERRWGVHGISSVWCDDVLPCRVYLRHCVLAAKGFCQEAYESFLDNTYLADRSTTIRQYLQQRPEIMDEPPPPELVGRYSG